MRVRLEIQLPTASIGYVCVELGRREVGVPEHLLDRAEIRAALEKVRSEGVPKQMWMDAFRLEPRLAGEPPEDQEDAGTGQAAALRVQEELRTVARVEVRAASREVAA
jgi:hypothetical protein